MNFLAKILLLILLFSFPARAEEEIQVGTGLVCDSAQQIERFVKEVSGDAQSTIAAINAEHPNACGVLSVAFIKVAEVSEVRSIHGSFQVISILVVAVMTEAGFQAIPPVQQFTLYRVQGQEI